MKIPFSALLLAGGRSSRMGEDKALIPYGHQPLWRHQVEKLKSAGAAEIHISRSRDQTAWESDIPFVFDRFEQRGPMGGIIAGMEASSHDLLMVLAVDLPLISLDVLEELKEFSNPGCGAIYFSDSYFEPLAALYPKMILPEMIYALEIGERSLQPLLKGWVEAGKMRALQIPPHLLVQWSNVNSPHQLNQIRNKS